MDNGRACGEWVASHGALQLPLALTRVAHCVRACGLGVCCIRRAARFTGNISLKTSGDMVRSGFATFRSLVRHPSGRGATHRRVACTSRQPAVRARRIDNR